ncbi:transmembrane protein 186 isoform X3 [Vespula squamosa]|uniref:Transmembrane protein 186 n=1 Tax=Vespula squamosa TaxID=30214 RepID=A0ABD2AVV5_VESSQ
MLYHLINRCMRTSSYRINNFKIDIKFLCQIPIKEKQILQQIPTIKNKNVTESKYPEYEIIYRFPYIKYISLFHKSKRNMLISSGVTIPLMFFLSQGNIISEIPAMFMSIIVTGFALSLYLTGILFTNQIGIIYFKDNESIKIAYVNEWGKRIDIDISINDIKPLEGLSSSIANKYFKNIYIVSLKHPLKLYVNYSIISNKEKLVNVLGDYE